MCVYLRQLAPHLGREVPMIFYTEAHMAPYVTKVREAMGFANLTKVVVLTRESNMAFWDVLPRTQEVFDQHFVKFWIHAFKGGFPEHRVAAYPWITHQKFDWMLQSAKWNPFTTDYFLWVDAGAGHGKKLGKLSKHICPCNIAYPGYATLFTTGVDSTRIYDIDVKHNGLKGWSLDAYVNGLYWENPTLIMGTFFAGDLEGLTRLFDMYNSTVRRMLDAGYADDEQAVLAAAVGELQPSWVRFIESNWEGTGSVC